MQHIKPMGKGDPLCPLGFHPQVRWPTRCKRCFRDYKEHGNRNKDQDYKLKRNDTTASSPTLSSWNSKPVEEKNNGTIGTRSWTSTSNLNIDSTSAPKNYENSKASSWTSTPDLDKLSNDTKPSVETTASVTLPRRRPQPKNDENSEDDYRRTQYTVRRRTSSNLLNKISTIEENDSTKKNEVNSVNYTNNNELRNNIPNDCKDDAESDVFTDAASTIHTDDTETIVNSDILQEQVESLKLELSGMKMRCEKAEKEKNDMLMRRVASLDNSMSTKTTSSELTKLQEKINNLNETCENLQKEKKTLMKKIETLENKKSNKSSTDSEIETLKSKLHAAESLCEELMDENEEMKRELKDMEYEIEEMQDNFRDNQADEYSSIKKELEQTAKNCRILSFKLRKSERKVEQLEADKFESERKSREAVLKLQKELEEVNEKLKLSSNEDVKKKAPMLGNIPKTPSGEKVSRASLTRGGSQEDPAQLLRDLQDSIEREADLREQLRYAEEEAQNLRKKVSRVEDDNESLLMQLKKMATKAKSRKSSPTHSRLNPESAAEKDEGISDDDDPTELRLLLELNEQETAVLRKKVEELEENCDILKRKASDLQDKLLTKDQKINPLGKRESNKLLEAEIADLKNKLLEKDRECKQLDSELSLIKKKSKNLQKTRSLDGDQSTIDSQRQLKIVEQEVSVLRARISSLENENEQLQAASKQLTITKLSKKASSQNETELKTKISSLEKQLAEKRLSKIKETNKKAGEEIEQLQRKVTELESDNARLITNLKVLKEGNLDGIKELHGKRTPKIISDTTSKAALKTMIQELENEIDEILFSQEKCLSLYKEKLEKESNSQDKKHLILELDKTKQTLEKVLAEQKEEKMKFEKEKEKLLNDKKKLENARSKLEGAKNKEKENEEEKKKLQLQLEELKEQMTRLTKELKNSQEKQHETNDQLSSAYSELEEKRKLVDKLKIECESARDTIKEDGKLKSEISDKKNKISELGKKLQELEEKSRKSERLVQVKKEKIMTMEKELENMKKENLSKKSAEQVEREKWTQKETELKDSINELNKQIKALNTKVEEKDKKIKDLEESIKQKSLNNKNQTAATSNAKISELESKLSSAQNEIKTLNDKLKQLETEKQEIEKVAAASNDLKTAVKNWKTNAEKLKSDLESERASIKQIKEEQTKQLEEKDAELKSLKKKILNVGDKKMNDIKKDFDSKIEDFRKQLEGKQKDYDELTAKYEQLEDEHVKIKSQMNLQKEQMQSQVLCGQRELATVQNELRTLRETYNNRQDNWIKEKLRLEEKIKELDNLLLNNETFKLEHNKVKLLLEVKESELEKLHKESIQQRDQLEHMRKENEELQKKLDDFDKVIKVQRNIVADASALETQITELKAKLYNEEKSRKVEVAALKLRYENHVSAISAELKDVQAQVMRFKHERNKYKQLLESAQKTATENKPALSAQPTNSEEAEELKSQIATLEQQISCMEDELSEARIESSRIKTELVSERSAWDVKVSEMTSRINELEEERLFQSGRTKTAGLKTRMELAWQKEREEQNRLLQETSTLARDLRQTLFEVERERDKERLEIKRRLEQMKKNADEEQEETKKKLHELQCDLLELRDAHAKLRTTNEKLRREKERTDRDKDVIRQTSRPNGAEFDQKKINYILDLVSELSKTVPLSADKGLPPVPNKKQSSSRESSVELRNTSRESSVAKDDFNTGQQQILQRLFEATRQIKANQYTPNFNRDVARKAFVSRRPASTESDKVAEVGGGLQRRGSLYRKCISLEQTAPTGEPQEQMIWRTDEDTDGSLTSFQSFDDSYNPRANIKFDQTFDSRLSGGSTHSEMLPSTLERKKKKGLLGKLKKFAKSSRSIDDDSDTFPLGSASQGNPGSNSSISSNIIPDQESVPRRDLKGRISDLFKKSDSRSNSMERTPNTTSSFEITDGSGTYDKRITESQTLPRRSTSSSTKTDKQLAPTLRAGATMPRNVSQKKPRS
ncbi:early endosome antigen 1 [Planococcus citri]|uniref:early endosome antigen 1 n=1 Tax=Planococcus citri TaxID=170843 RepID=UPI0031F94E2A